MSAELLFVFFSDTLRPPLERRSLASEPKKPSAPVDLMDWDLMRRSFGVSLSLPLVHSPCPILCRSPLSLQGSFQLVHTLEFNCSQILYLTVGIATPRLWNNFLVVFRMLLPTFIDVERLFRTRFWQMFDLLRQSSPFFKRGISADAFWGELFGPIPTP